MEFKTRISEQDHLAAARLMFKSAVLSFFAVIGYVVFFGGGIAILGTFVWMRLNPMASVAQRNFEVTVFNLMPFVITTVLIALLYRVYIPWDLRNKYRKNVNNIGELTEVLDEDGISELSSAGSSIRHPWTVCSHWRESKAVFVLVLQSKIYFTYPKAWLSAPQQDETRSILSEHLPKK